MIQILSTLYNTLIAGKTWLTLLRGLWVTVQISVLALLVGTLLGALICALRRSRFMILRGFAKLYIAVLRGSPVLLLLMLLYYVVFARSPLDAVFVAVIAFGLNTAAYVAELMRSALDATDKGQVEAARTLGFSRWEAFRLITLPQAAEIAEPVYQSTIVNLIQWTSVVGYVTITDLTRVINNISSRTMQPLLMIVTGIVLYLALAYVVNGIFALLHLYKKHRRTNKA